MTSSVAAGGVLDWAEDGLDAPVFSATCLSLSRCQPRSYACDKRKRPEQSTAIDGHHEQTAGQCWPH